MLYLGDSLMTQTITGISLREAEFLSIWPRQNRSIFRYEEVAAYWSDAAVARHALSRLQRCGWLKRIGFDLYMLVPLSAGPDRVWTENALVIGLRLIEPSDARTGRRCAFWNFTEQMPHTVFVQSPRRKPQLSWSWQACSTRS